MTNPSSNSDKPSPGQGRIEILSITRGKFDAVPKKRALYIGLYVVAFLLWLYASIGQMRLAAELQEQSDAATESATEELEETAPETEPIPEVIAMPPMSQKDKTIQFLIKLCLALFYIPYISVLRTMAYPWIAVIAFCGFVFLPIPGLFVVAYIDTRIAKAWNKAKGAADEAQAQLDAQA